MSVGQPVSTMLVAAATTPVRLSTDVFRTHGCVMLGRQDNQPTLAAGTVRARLPNPWYTLLLDTGRTVTSIRFDGATVGKNTMSLILFEDSP